MVARSADAIEVTGRRIGPGTAVRRSGPVGRVVVALGGASHQRLRVDRMARAGAPNGRTSAHAVPTTEAAARASDLAGPKRSPRIDRLDLDPAHRPVDVDPPGVARAGPRMTGRGSTGHGKVATADRPDLATRLGAAVRGARRGRTAQGGLQVRLVRRRGSTRIGHRDGSRPIARLAASRTRDRSTALSRTASQGGTAKRDRLAASGLTAFLDRSRGRESHAGSPGREHRVDSNRVGRAARIWA